MTAELRDLKMTWERYKKRYIRKTDRKEKIIWIMALFVVLLTIMASQFIILGTLDRSYNDNHNTLKINTWAYQLQNASPDEISHSGFDLVVMDYSRDGTPDGEYSWEEIKKIKDMGIMPLAYLSIGEAEDYRFYWDANWYKNPPEWLGNENPEWKGNYAVKYWNKEWRKIIYKYIKKIVSQGFMGLYLDKVDEFEYWSNPDNGEDIHLSREEAAKRMIKLILDIEKYARSIARDNFYIVPQNGEGILQYDNGTLIRIVSGWAAEDLFYNSTLRWNASERMWIENHRFPYLLLVLKSGKPVMCVDYVDDGSGYKGENKMRIESFREEAIKEGFIPYAAISDRELDELNIIPGVQP